MYHLARLVAPRSMRDAAAAEAVEPGGTAITIGSTGSEGRIGEELTEDYGARRAREKRTDT